MFYACEWVRDVDREKDNKLKTHKFRWGCPKCNHMNIDIHDDMLPKYTRLECCSCGYEWKEVAKEK